MTSRVFIKTILTTHDGFKYNVIRPSYQQTITTKI